MKLYEHQGKSIFREAGIQVPDSILLRPGDEIDFHYPAMAKAQMLEGKRGKAGLIRRVENAAEAKAVVDGMFARGISSVLLETAVDFTDELYVSISVDPVQAKALILASREGGVDIEELAATSPEKIKRIYVNPEQGLMPYQCRGLGYDLGFDKALTKQFTQFLTKLFYVFIKNDAELVEVNPLFVTTDGELVAGDSKITIDDASLYRQPGFEMGRDHFDSDIAYEAFQDGFPYLQFEGNISLMCAGAGLTTTVFDLVNYAGGKVCNYLEFGGPNYRKGVRAMELCLKNEQARVLLIVTFGTIARADVMAESVKEGIETFNPTIPIVACIRGTGEEEATRILRSIGLEPLFDTEEAVARAIQLAEEQA